MGAFLSHEEVKLLGAVESPFVTRVVLALKLKGIEYKFQKEDPHNNKSEELLKYNPVYKKVPVFVHNEKPISESLVILEYLDEIWKKKPILPSDPYQKAQARFWSKFIDEKVVTASWGAVFTNDEKQRQYSIEESNKALQFVEDELKEKYFGGEEIGFVDIAAVFIAFWIPLIQEMGGIELFTSEKFPKLYKWSQEFLSHPIVKENMPPRDHIFAFLKPRYDSATSSK